MPKKPLIRTADYPYHVTSRSNNKEWFYIPTSEVWKFSQKLLEESVKKFEIDVRAFVLMSNHYHLLIFTPQANLDKFMCYFNQNLGKSIARSAGRINRIFGASYKWNLIQSQSCYLNVLSYL